GCGCSGGCGCGGGCGCSGESGGCSLDYEGSHLQPKDDAVVVAAAVVKMITLLMLLAAKGFELKTKGREYIAAKLTANLITAVGADRVLACDLHSGQSMGYFDILVDYVYCQLVILDYLASKPICSSDLVVVSPDVGGFTRARAFVKNLSDAPLAIIDKMHHGHNVAKVMSLIGDVKGKVAVMVDDMIDTAGSEFFACLRMEEQFILRVPPSVAERIKRLLNESPSDDKSLDLSFSDNGMRGTFTIADD
ncbi:ribose-phosphate pyrophosphokinase 1-like protein, partial [Tanacetum coccineum]